MKIVLPILFLLLGAFPLLAGSLADALPEHSVFLLQVDNVQKARTEYQSSPLAEALSDVDPIQMMLSIYQKALEEGEVENPEELSVEELEAKLTKYSVMLKGILDHMEGEMIFGVGSLENAIRTFQEVSKIRETLYDDVSVGDEEDNANMEAIAKQEEQLELREMLAVFNEFYFLAEVKDGEALLGKIDAMLNEAMREQMYDQSEVMVEKLEWDGLPVYTLKGRDIDPDAEEQEDFVSVSWWTVKNNVWISRGTEEGLRKTLLALDAAPANRLSSTAGYVDAMQFLGDQDTRVYMDFSRIDPLIRLAVGEEALNKAMNGGKTMAAVMDWLGADAMMPYALGMSTREDGMHGKARFGFSRETVLSRMLIDPSQESAPIPPFLHKDMGQISSMRWGLGQGLRRIETEIGAFQPELTAGLGVLKAMMIGQLGMDVQSQFLDHFGTGVVMVQELDAEVMNDMIEMAEEADPAKQMQFRMEHPTNGQNYLLALELKNQEMVTSGLNTLLARVHPAGLPEPKMFQGHAIHSPMPGGEDSPMAKLVTYTILDGYLVMAIGDESMLHDAIRASNEPASRLIQDPAFQELRDQLPEGVMFEYTPRSVQQGAWEVIGSSLQAAGLELKGLPDMEKLGAVFGDSYSTAVRKGTVFETEIRSTFAPPAE